MAWRIEFTPAAARALRKLDRQVARRIGRYLQDLVGLWRYRVGDYRVICQLEDDQLLVLVVRIAHRSEAYPG